MVVASYDVVRNDIDFFGLEFFYLFIANKLDHIHT